MQKKITTKDAKNLINIYAMKKPTHNMEKTIIHRFVKRNNNWRHQFFQFISGIYVIAKKTKKLFHNKK